MLAVYSASKAFLRTWSESLAAELAPKGVVVEHANTYYVVRLLPSFHTRVKNDSKLTRRLSLTDFGNVENSSPIAVHPYSKSLCARSSREDRAGHDHAVLDTCVDRRSLEPCALQGGAGIHARAVEGY
jgi:hypothetical protein